MVKLKPSSSGTMEPKTIPNKVDSCQEIHKVIPEPNR